MNFEELIERSDRISIVCESITYTDTKKLFNYIRHVKPMSKVYYDPQNYKTDIKNAYSFIVLHRRLNNYSYYIKEYFALSDIIIKMDYSGVIKLIKSRWSNPDQIYNLYDIKFLQREDKLKKLLTIIKN